MKFLHSIGWRLQIWYGVLLVVVLSGFGTTAFQLESGRQLRRVDEELRRRLPPLVESQRPVPNNRAMREFALLPRHAPLFDDSGDGFYHVVWLRHSERPVTFSTGAPRDVPQPKADEPPVRQRGNFREVFLFPGPGDCVLVGRSIAADAAGLRQLAWWLSGVGGAVLVLGLAVGAWLVRRALRPIQDISTTAGHIATGTLKQRINTSDTESELGQLAEVLNSTFARLDAAFTQQARFTADAAHELRTPVTVMLTHAQNGLDANCNCEEHREAFEATRRAAQRMRRLIESLLELARLDAGQEAFRREPFDLALVARECIELVSPLAEERRITIQAELPDGSCFCNGDADRIGQVITNLLTNAIVHNNPGGEVRVHAQRENGSVVLTVADNGPGIAPEDLPHIFDRFYRADKSRSRGGTGLGLAISKAIIEAHGGCIAAKSEAGAGASFMCKLPLSKD